MTRSTDDLGCKARCAVSGADIADGATRGGTDDFILIPDVQVGSLSADPREVMMLDPDRAGGGTRF
eukprot:870605-Rhodomonas_salina.2